MSAITNQRSEAISMGTMLRVVSSRFRSSNQVIDQSLIERVIGCGLDVIDASVEAGATEFGSPSVDGGEVLFANALGVSRDLLSRFQIAETDVAIERQVPLPRIPDLKGKDFMLAVSKLIQPSCDGVHVVEEVADDDHHAAVLTQLGRLMQSP